MPTTLPLAALVVIAIGLLVLAVLAFTLCLRAMRGGNLFEADIKAASFRYTVRVHPAPFPVGPVIAEQRDKRPTFSDPEKITPGPE
jgi:hypothetical protein